MGCGIYWFGWMAAGGGRQGACFAAASFSPTTLSTAAHSTSQPPQPYTHPHSGFGILPSPPPFQLPAPPPPLQVLERGEKIELLVDKTDNLRFQVGAGWGGGCLTSEGQGGGVGSGGVSGWRGYGRCGAA